MPLPGGMIAVDYLPFFRTVSTGGSDRASRRGEQWRKRYERVPMLVVPRIRSADNAARVVPWAYCRREKVIAASEAVTALRLNCPKTHNPERVQIGDAMRLKRF